MSWDPNEPPPPYPGNFHQSNNFNPQQPNNFNSSQFNIPSNNIVHPFAPSHNIQHSFEPHGYPTDPRKPPNIPTEIWSWFVVGIIYLFIDTLSLIKISRFPLFFEILSDY